jgi:hypothetical protein
LEQFGFIDQDRPNFAHAGNGLAAVSMRTSINYFYGSTAFPNILLGPTDPGPNGAFYAGTLTLDVPLDASGTFTVGFDITPPTITISSFFDLYPPGGGGPDIVTVGVTSQEPLVIRIAPGACCDGQTASCTVTSHPLCTCAECTWTADASCEQITCLQAAIPTVSHWGLLFMTLLLLIAGKLYRPRSVSPIATRGS